MLARAQAACQLTSSPLKEIPLLLILCGFIIFLKFAERKPSTKSPQSLLGALQSHVVQTTTETG